MTLLPFISESQKVWHFKEIRLITFQMKEIMNRIQYYLVEMK